MRRLTTKEEIKALERKLVVCVFSNFQQLVNRRTEQEALEMLQGDPFNLCLVGDFFGDEKSIYDLGSGYYMIIDKQGYHKAVNRMLVRSGVEQPLTEFDETTSIYRVID